MSAISPPTAPRTSQRCPQRAHLDEIAGADIRYVAHEYLTPHGDPFYFADVEAAMHAAGLSFAGSMVPADNYPALMVPRQFRELVATAPSRSVLETHRDFIANTAFRQDLYAKQPRAVPPADLPRARRSRHWCSAWPTSLNGCRCAATRGPVKFDLSDRGDAVRAIHACLAEGPASAEALHRAVGGAEQDTTFLIQQLVVARHLAPCPPTRAPAGWHPLNGALVEAALNGREREVSLACTRTGSATRSEPVHAAIIEAAVGTTGPEAAAQAVLARLRRAGHPVQHVAAAAAAREASDAEILAYVEEKVRRLRDRRSAEARVLGLFGILEPG